MNKAIIDLYRVNELSAKALDKAYYNWALTQNYYWETSNIETLKAFEKIFPVSIEKWEYGYQHYISYELDCDENIARLEGVRLMKYIINNYDYIFHEKREYKYYASMRKSNVFYKDTDCPLTGYHMDIPILYPIRVFLKHPSANTSFHDLMGECLNSWLESCYEDYTSYYSKESFIEDSFDNSYLYLSDGTLIDFNLIGGYINDSISDVTGRW